MITLGAALALACGGKAADDEDGDEDDDEVSSGGQSAESTGGASPGVGGLGGQGGDQGGSGGQEGSGGFPALEWGERAFCGESIPVTPRDDWCEGADKVLLTVSLRGASDDAEIMAGQDAVATVEMINPQEAHLNYPCVGLAFDHPGLQVTTPMNPYYDAFALQQDTPLEYEMGFTVAADVPSGTVVHGLIWFDSLNSRCENGAQIEFQFEVQ